MGLFVLKDDDSVVGTLVNLDVANGTKIRVLYHSP